MEACTYQDNNTKEENQLFKYIEHHKVDELKKLLHNHGHRINFRATNNDGFTCLEAAVFSQNEEMVSLILAYGNDNMVLDDALLLAARLQNETITNILLKSLSNEQTYDDDVQSDSAQELGILTSFSGRCIVPSSLTEIRHVRQTYTLNEAQAVYCKAYEMGNTSIINKCKEMGTPLPTIEESLKLDSGDFLNDFSNRLIILKAVTSPTYLSENADPVIAAFEMNSTIKLLSRKYPEYWTDLRALAAKSEQYAVDLLNLCETEQQIRTMLSLEYYSSALFARIKYGRILAALIHNQKKFVAHPKCQIFVNSVWTKELQWRNSNYLRRALHIIICAITMPFITIVTLIDSKKIPDLANKPATVPLNRFIYSATSYICFLIMLLLYLMLNSPTNQTLLICLTVYVITALLRVLCTNVPMHGIRTFLRTFWSVYDLVMYFIFIVAFICILIDHSYHQLIDFGNSTLSIASILAILRLFSWFHLHEKLGPFIIAFKNILYIVYSLLLVFVILFFAFAFSLHFLYQDISPQSSPEESYDSVFGMLSSTFSVLFWTMYGYAESDYTSIHHNATEAEKTSTLMRQYTGIILWATFHVACIIVLVNMLIAMMTVKFEKIYENCDMEWKFACTKMKLYYFEDCTAIPEPFNIIYYARVCPKWFRENCDTIWNRMKCSSATSTSRNTTNEIDRCNTNSTNIPLEENIHQPLSQESSIEKKEYKKLMKHLQTLYRRNKTLEQSRKGPAQAKAENNEKQLLNHHSDSDSKCSSMDVF